MYQFSSFTNRLRVSHTTLESNKQFIEISSKKYAIFACSIHSPSVYYFYAPIITLAWQRIGYQAIVIFVGDFNKLKNKKPALVRVVVEWVVRFGGIALDFQCPEEYSIKTSQILRVFVGFLPFSFFTDEDFLLISDSDLIPLKHQQYLHRQDYPDGFIINHFCCGLFKRRNRTYHMFPMGHLGVRRRIWQAMVLESVIHKELVAIEAKRDQHPSGSYEESLLRKYTNGLSSLLLHENRSISFEILSLYPRHEFRTLFDHPMSKGDDAWSMDQILISMLFIDYRNRTKAGQQLRIDERSLLERLDREYSISSWANRSNFSRYGDAHLHQSIFVDNFWPTYLRLFNAIFNTTIVQLLNEYATDYLLLPMNWM